MMARFTFLILVLFCTTAGAAAQGAHYTYPFSLQCSEIPVAAGEKTSVSVIHEGGFTGERYSPTYNWSLSSGTIVSGQGTPAIEIEIARDETATINVTLDRTFGEAHFPGVQGSATCSIEVIPRRATRLFDEFATGGRNCEEGFARLDGFFTELASNPVDQGVIVLYNDVEDVHAAARRELQLQNHFAFRNFPRERVTFVRGVARVRGTTQFWLVPPGADVPEIDRMTALVEKVPTEPYLYAANYLDGVPGCGGHIFDIGGYARELKSIPGSRGRIVIRETSRRKFQRAVADITSELAAAGISRRRFTAVYKYVRPNRLLEVTELWVIP